jgi:Zn-dependent alcohol dehydrogenase
MAVTTQALVSREVNVPPKLEQITLDAIQADEVLVEIHATGICHTEFSCMNGTLPSAFPSVLGHEGTPPSHPSTTSTIRQAYSRVHTDS